MSVEVLVEHEETASTGAETRTTFQPACSMANAEHLEWRETPYTAALADFDPPCGNPECFPDGMPDPDAFETVIRSRHFPTVFHRPSEVESDRGPVPLDQVPESEHEPIDTITDLSESDGVVWGASRLPLVVVSATSDPAGTVELRGPDGGEYELDGRPGNIYALDRGYGCVSGVRRIPSDAVHTQRPDAGSPHERDAGHSPGEHDDLAVVPARRRSRWVR